MKPEDLYRLLRELAEKLGVTVAERNLRKAGIAVQSGLCRVHGRLHYIMDKHLPQRRKNRLLAECLGRMPRESVFMPPAVRDYIERVEKEMGLDGSKGAGPGVLAGKD